MIVAFPAPVTFATPFVNVMTDGSDEVYDHVPFEVDVGGINVKSGSLTTFCISDHDPILGVPTTVSFIETGEGEAYVEVGAWVAVTVVMPGL